MYPTASITHLIFVELFQNWEFQIWFLESQDYLVGPKFLALMCLGMIQAVELILHSPLEIDWGLNSRLNDQLKFNLQRKRRLVQMKNYLSQFEIPVLDSTYIHRYKNITTFPVSFCNDSQALRHS